MQTGSLAVLMGMVAGPTAGTDAQLAGAGAGTGQGFDQLFEQLMQGGFEPGIGSEAFAGGNSAAMLQQMTATASTGAALSAQEITASVGEIGALPNQNIMKLMVSPADVPAIISRIDQVMKQSGTPEADVQLLSQIRAQVLNIQQSGEPKSVAQLLQGVVSPKQSGISHSGLIALIVPHKHKNDEQSPSTQEEAPTHVAELWQNMQAGMFRAVDGAVKAPTETPLEKTKKEQPVTSDDSVALVTVVQPTAENIEITLPVPPPKATEALLSVSPTPSAMQEKDSDPVADIDATIPPLSQGLSDTSVILPVVQLPSMVSTQPLAPSPIPSQQTEVAMPQLSAVGSQPANLNVDDSAIAKPRALTIDDQAQLDDTTTQKDTAPSFATALASVTNDKANASVPVVSAAMPSHAVATTHSHTLNLTPTPGYINQAPVTEQVRVAINKAGKDGMDKITIQLEPVELGRVEVSMHANRDGITQIQFTVDKPETFDSLSRDARHLERSLQEAGIKADTGSMQFNLRQQPQQQNLQADVNSQGQQQRQPAPTTQPQASNEQPSSTTVAVATPTITNHYILNVREGVDISA